MNKEIERMIIELEKECKAQNVELLLCATNFETGQGSTARVSYTLAKTCR